MSALVNTLRWFARISGLLIAGMYTLMVIGEFTHPHSSAPSTVLEWSGIVLLTATCAGMLIGWRWELPGAILSLVALVIFTLIIHMRYHTILFVFATPGILFLADWLVRQRNSLTASE
jgi:hypothetical protein